MSFEELWRARIGSRAYAELIDREHIGFPAVHAECDFTAPLRFGDTAVIDVAISGLGKTSITFHYHVYKDGERERTLCAEGRVVCAVVDLARFVSVAVPDRVIAMLSDLVEPGA